MFSVGIITASDKGSKGLRDDKSGKMIKQILSHYNFQINKYIVLPDEINELETELLYMCDTLNLNLVLTTGGTGFSKRDVTPEATKRVITKEVPGISEAMRFNSLKITPRAMLSRGISGIRNNTLIINLPGSPKAVKECLEYIIDTLIHGLEILLDLTNECARK